jgi:hypothetical protein
MPSSSSSSGGRLVKVAYAPTQIEAEMIQGLLAEHGIPSMLKRPFSLGSANAPIGIGPQEVFVPEEAAEIAREVLPGGLGGS